MHGQELSENRRLKGHCAQCRRAEPRETVQREHAGGHPCRTPGETAMRGLIGLEIAAGQCLGERPGLVKRLAQAFARDGIHRAGSIAYQNSSIAIDAAQPP